VLISAGRGRAGRPRATTSAGRDRHHPARVSYAGTPAPVAGTAAAGCGARAAGRRHHPPPGSSTLARFSWNHGVCTTGFSPKFFQLTPAPSWLRDHRPPARGEAGTLQSPGSST
jgi:hypothetical protein